MAVPRNKKCVDCSRALRRDEVALSMKMLGRDIDEFYCIEHLAVFLECSAMDLEIKIEEFKEQGCGLFM